MVRVASASERDAVRIESIEAARATALRNR